VKQSALNIGVIGLGMGMSHAITCSTLPGVKLKALSDANPKRLTKSAKKLGVDETYSDGLAMIQQADLDAVVVALPNHMHADVSIAALKQGLHVLVEKPIATDVPSAEAMIHTAREADRVLMVGFNQRFEPMHHTAWRYINQGHLGNIYYAKTNWLRRRDVPWWFEDGGKGALSTHIAGGGPLIDLGVHKLDLVLFLLGFPKVASVDGTTFRGIGKAEGRKRGIDFVLEDAATALIRFEHNRALLLEASWCMHRKQVDTQETTLFGDTGGMHIDTEVEVFSEADGIQLNTQLLPEDNTADGGITGHFCRVASGKEPPIVTPDQALTGLRIITAIYESARTGKTAYFD
jgi:predicted dehydrogenase